MNLIHLLQKLDLTEIECAVYLQALKKERQTATDIAGGSGIKRSTIYHILHGLTNKGMITATGKTVSRFRATPADQLVDIVERKQADLASLKTKLAQALPFFPISESQNSAAPLVEEYFGLAGTQTLVERMLRCQTKMIHVIGAPFNLMESPDNVYIRELLAKRARLDIHTKSIWQDTPTDAEIKNNAMLLREVRLAPPALREKSKSMICMFDSNVLILNFLPELSGIYMDNRSLHDTMMGIWQTIWNQSTPL